LHGDFLAEELLEAPTPDFPRPQGLDLHPLHGKAFPEGFPGKTAELEDSFLLQEKSPLFLHEGEPLGIEDELGLS
jgi:hypothetical protein